MFAGLMMRAGLLAALFLVAAGPAGAVFDDDPARFGNPPPAAAPPPATPPESTPPVPPLSESICPMIESAAATHGLPIGFFTRLIWQESSFRPHAVSPAGAQGVAQFMPETAAERGLSDPLDPVQAIPKSAELLRDLRSQFGNLGLAAAAYNAGPRRVQDWLAGLGGLPLETRDYVRVITGHAAEDWMSLADAVDKPGIAPAGPLDCRRFAALAALPKAGRSLAPGLPTAKSTGPWGVQISGNFSQSAALAAFQSTKKRYRKLLGDHAPMVIRTRMPSRGARPFYRVRVGMKTRAAAEDLCSKLRAAGGACVVLKN